MANWPDLIKGAIARGLDGVHTSIPARVTAYVPGICTCTAQPVVPGMPEIDDIPVVWPRGGAYYLHMPLASGDHVLLVFAEVDFSAWALSGVSDEPSLLRRHGLYAVAVPGVAPITAPLAAPVVLGGAVLGTDTGAQLRVSGAAVSVGLSVLPTVLHAAVAEQVAAQWIAFAAAFAAAVIPEAATATAVKAAMTAAVAAAQGIPVASTVLELGA